MSIKVTMDENEVASLADLIFAEVAETLAQEVKEWQITAIYTPQEKAATKRILNDISKTYAAAALTRRNRIPKETQATRFFNIIRRRKG